MWAKCRVFYVEAGLCKNVSTLFTFVSMEWGVIDVWHYSHYKVMTESINESHDVHGSVHHNINLIERTNKMPLCSRIYYSNVS